MMTIKVVSIHGHPPEQLISGEFDELGGVIGRADGNALVLPDPERYVSRVHATIAFRGGKYVIRDVSSASPVYVNDKPLGNGNEVELHHGDGVRIGAYALQATMEMAQNQPSVAQRKAGQGGIPDDFDPFGDVFSAPPKMTSGLVRSATENAADDANVELGLGPASSQDIDQLFDLSPGTGADFFSDDDPLAAQHDRPGAAPSLDPLVAFGAMAAPQPGAVSRRDDTPEIRAAFIPPSATFGAVPAPESSAAPADSTGMFFSWDAAGKKNSGDIKAVIIASPSMRAQAASDARVQLDVDQAATASAGQAESSAASAAAQDRAESNPRPLATISSPSPAGPDTCSEQELLDAFLAGAGVPNLEMAERLTPQMMYMFGQLLRESTQGTLDLLLARALIKREVHAQMTMIVPRENNPLKFSPSVEAALSHLLAPRGQGFMPPLSAMQDAYDDLRAHQFGFMAGMRAALSGVLRRFDPVQLEQRLTGKSMVDSLMPMNRKAKLWSLFAELYSDITKEAEDDFHTLFGKEFLRAYEAQLAKLDRSDQDARH